MHKIATVWMLVNKTGQLVAYHAPAESYNAAWRAARKQFGAFGTLQLRRQGYTPQQVHISLGERTWREQSLKS